MRPKAKHCNRTKRYCKHRQAAINERVKKGVEKRKIILKIIFVTEGQGVLQFAVEEVVANERKFYCYGPVNMRK